MLLVYSGGPGLDDPCETGMVDASAKLTAQERANITLSAQVWKGHVHLPVVAYGHCLNTV